MGPGMGRIDRLKRAATWWRRTRGALGVVADAATVVTLIFAILGSALRGTVEDLVLTVYVVLLASILLVIVVQQGNRLGRRARQSESLPRFAEALAQLTVAAEGLFSLRSMSAEVRAGALPAAHRAYVATVNQALQTLNESFEIAVSLPCRVTLLETWQPTFGPHGEAAGDTAVRRVASSEPLALLPAGATTAPDWVNGNTDFRTIMRGADYFFCNDLATELAKGYQNSHWTDEVIQNRQFPYRSTIVWPVRGQVSTETAGAAWDIVGFLCVDTKRRGAFVRTVDVATGAAYASALYSGVSAYRSSRKEHHQGEAPASEGTIS